MAGETTKVQKVNNGFRSFSKLPERAAYAVITGNPGSLCACVGVCVTWVNIENIWGKD